MFLSKWLMGKYLYNYSLPFHDNHVDQSILPYNDTGKLTYQVICTARVLR